MQCSRSNTPTAVMIYLYTDFAKLDVISLDHYRHFRLDLDFKKLEKYKGTDVTSYGAVTSYSLNRDI